jgi:hypothetical protein
VTRSPIFVRRTNEPNHADETQLSQVVVDLHFHDVARKSTDVPIHLWSRKPSARQSAADRAGQLAGPKRKNAPPRARASERRTKMIEQHALSVVARSRTRQANAAVQTTRRRSSSSEATRNSIAFGAIKL